MDFSTHLVGENIEVVANSGMRRSEIKKVNGKIVRKRSYLEESLGESGVYIVSGSILRKIKEGDTRIYTLSSGVKTKIEKLSIRKYLDKKIDILVKRYPRGLKAFYRGVIIGDKENLDRELKDKFSYTGTSHLIVISGLHIGVIIALIMYITGKLPISHDTRYILAIVILSLYILAVGMTPSIIRAYTMGMCYLGGGLLYEEPEAKRSLVVAMIINLFIDPLGAGRISFQMSYIAVFTILFIYPYFEKGIKSIKNKPLKLLCGMGSLSLVIQILLTPIFMMNFRSIPIFSFFVNILAIPIGVFFVQGAFLALLFSMVGLGGFFMPTVNVLYIILVRFIEWAAELPLLSVEYRGVTKDWYILLIYTGLYLFISKRTRVVSLLPLAFIMMGNRERGEDYKGAGYSYYFPRVISVSKKLYWNDIDSIWNSKITEIDYLIAPKKQEKMIMKKLRVREIIVLKKDEEVEVRGRVFRNIKGNIEVNKE